MNRRDLSWLALILMVGATAVIGQVWPSPASRVQTVERDGSGSFYEAGTPRSDTWIMHAVNVASADTAGNARAYCDFRAVRSCQALVSLGGPGETATISFELAADTNGAMGRYRSQAISFDTNAVVLIEHGGGYLRVHVDSLTGTLNARIKRD